MCDFHKKVTPKWIYNYCNLDKNIKYKLEL